MANFLFKKSFQLKTFKPIVYDDLWGKRGVFSTIRVTQNHNYILLNNHIKNINSSLKKLNINFALSEKKLIRLLSPLFSRIDRHDYLFRVAINSKIISISLRKRLEPDKNFHAILFLYQRPKPSLKNLYYKGNPKKTIPYKYSKKRNYFI